MKKNLWISCTAAAVVALLLMIFLPVLAAPSVSPSLRFEGTTAVAEVAITAKKEQIDITVKLLEAAKEEDREAASWHLAGEGQVSLCERVEAVPGRNYILTLEGTIGSRTIHVNSVSATCPGEESIETQPAEPEPSVPEETKPAPTEPEETQPALTEPEDSKPAPTEPVETQKPAIYDEQFGSFSPLNLQNTALVEEVGSLYLTDPLASLLKDAEDDSRFAVWVYPYRSISISETLGDVQEMAEKLTAAGIEAEVIPYWYFYRCEGNAVEDRAPIAYTVKTTLTKTQILELSGENEKWCVSLQIIATDENGVRFQQEELWGRQIMGLGGYIYFRDENGNLSEWSNHDPELEETVSISEHLEVSRVLTGCRDISLPLEIDLSLLPEGWGSYYKVIVSADNEALLRDRTAAGWKLVQIGGNEWIGYLDYYQIFSLAEEEGHFTVRMR